MKKSLLGNISSWFAPSSPKKPRKQQKYVHTDVLESSDLEGIAKHLQGCKNVVVLVGAGMSVGAGIPDFRTPGSGLYDNLKQYGLKFAEAIFDLRFFVQRPEPFYDLCKYLWPGQYKPTASHYFVKLLHDKGLLQRCFTQNIDSLETCAGVPADKVVAAHGNFDSATCIATNEKVPVEEVREAVMSGQDKVKALNEKYGGLVKPDIVFFGENLPSRFMELSKSDLPKCDLLIVLGTSLQVQPFAGLVREVMPDVPRLLVNRERVGEHKGRMLSRNRSPAFQFDLPNSRDVFFKGDCDAGVWELARLMGWEADLWALQPPDV
jgi:NAD-dependent deacetylase sirtuin 2